MSVFEEKVNQLEKNFKELRRMTLILNLENNVIDKNPFSLFMVVDTTITEYIRLLQESRVLNEFLGFFDTVKHIDFWLNHLEQDIIDYDPQKAGF